MNNRTYDSILDRVFDDSCALVMLAIVCWLGAGSLCVLSTIHETTSVWSCAIAPLCACVQPQLHCGAANERCRWTFFMMHKP